MKIVQRRNNRGWRKKLVEWLIELVKRFDKDQMYRPVISAKFLDALDVHGIYRITMPTPFVRPSQESIDSAKEAIKYRMIPHLSQFVSYKERLRFEGSVPHLEIIGTLWVAIDRDGELES